jgi:nucleotide-binding universal stress UspA family protein
MSDTPRKTTFHKIMVGIDFSDSSLEALEQALHMADLCGAEILLTYVGHWKDTPTMMPIPRSDERWETLMSKLPPTASASIRAICDRYPDVHTSKLLVDGDAAKALAMAAKELAADLIVVGTHGRTGIDHFLLGSVAERTVRAAECSVLVARPRKSQAEDFRNILVASDYSELGDHALAVACELADEGADIELLHVWQPPHLGGAEWDMFALSGEAIRELHEEARQAGLHKGNEVVGQWKSKTAASLRFTQVEGRPAVGIKEQLEKEPFDLVVVGSHGRKGVKRWLLGSVAEMTVRYAPCSVLVVR